jgi:hypothetical protein
MHQKQETNVSGDKRRQIEKQETKGDKLLKGGQMNLSPETKGDILKNRRQKETNCLRGDK